MAASRFFVDELVDGLAKLSETRRLACLFALEARISPEQVEELTWQQANEIEPTQLMREVLRAIPRHIQLPYVFWEHASETLHTPLMGFREGVTAAFGRSFEQLADDYSAIVMIDRRKDAEHFLDMVSEISSGQL